MTGSTGDDDLSLASEIGFSPDRGRFIFTDDDGVDVATDMATDNQCGPSADTVRCGVGVAGITQIVIDLDSGADSLVTFFTLGPWAPLDVDGGSGIDTITGGDSADRIDGGTGSDVITGGSGLSTIRGDDGNDRVTGGNSGDNVSGETGHRHADRRRRQ